METKLTLAEIQALVKAPKSNYNNFGKYKYRSAEDILDAAKKVLNPLGFYITLEDEIVLIGDRYYIKATALICNGEKSYSSNAFAREEELVKGMNSAQITGSASSYARKYALSGLLALDDTKDADATNEHKDETPTDGEKRMLIKLVYGSDLTEDERVPAFGLINKCDTYSKYQKIQHKLEVRQLPLDQIANPSPGDIDSHLFNVINSK